MAGEEQASAHRVSGCAAADAAVGVVAPALDAAARRQRAREVVPGRDGGEPGEGNEVVPHDGRGGHRAGKLGGHTIERAVAEYSLGGLRNAVVAELTELPHSPAHHFRARGDGAGEAVARRDARDPGSETGHAEGGRLRRGRAVAELTERVAPQHSTPPSLFSTQVNFVPTAMGLGKVPLRTDGETEVRVPPPK